MGAPALIFCASNGPSFARAAVAEGWLYGARLPATVYAEPWFVDQDWRRPNRRKYMTSLARRRPSLATVLDWERESQLPEVLSWARQAACYVREAVVVVPKVVGGVACLPRAVGGKRVVLGYSVPTSYGRSPVPLEEFHGWPVHLLGGSPQTQLRLYRLLRPHCEITSVDGNMAGQQARRGRFWSEQKGPKGHWRQLSETGDCRREGAALECFRRSLRAIRAAFLRLWGIMRKRRPHVPFFPQETC